jgi:hypothetical protein
MKGRSKWKGEKGAEEEMQNYEQANRQVLAPLVVEQKERATELGKFRTWRLALQCHPPHSSHFFSSSVGIKTQWNIAYSARGTQTSISHSSHDCKPFVSFQSTLLTLFNKMNFFKQQSIKVMKYFNIGLPVSLSVDLSKPQIYYAINSIVAINTLQTKQRNPWLLFYKRKIPTERPPLFD